LASILQRLTNASPFARFAPSATFAPLLSEPARRVLIRGPNRIGKSRHMAWLAAYRAVHQPGHRCRVVGPTNSHTQRVLGEYLAQFLDGALSSRSYYVTGRGWNGGRVKDILLSNGSSIELRSLEDHVQAHSGVALDLIVMDEPPTRAHLIENQARIMDTDGQLFIGATMVGRPVAYLRQIVEGDERSPTAGRTEHATGWTQYVASLTVTACPWYTERQLTEHRERMRSAPWEWAQRVEGAWHGTDDDRVLRAFDDQCVSSALPGRPFVLGLGMDHGESVGHTHALIAVWNETQGAMHVMDEYTNPEGADHIDDARGLLAAITRCGAQPTDVRVAVGDINTAGKAHPGWRINDLIQAECAQLTFRRSPPFVIKGPDKTPGSVHWGLRCINHGFRRRTLTIHPRCKHLIDACRYWKGGKKGEDGEYSHAIDAMRYLVVAALGHRTDHAQLRFS